MPRWIEVFCGVGPPVGTEAHQHAKGGKRRPEKAAPELPDHHLQDRRRRRESQEVKAHQTDGFPASVRLEIPLPYGWKGDFRSTSGYVMAQNPFSYMSSWTGGEPASLATRLGFMPSTCHHPSSFKNLLSCMNFILFLKSAQDTVSMPCADYYERYCFCVYYNPPCSIVEPTEPVHRISLPVSTYIS